MRAVATRNRLLGILPHRTAAHDVRGGDGEAELLVGERFDLRLCLRPAGGPHAVEMRRNHARGTGSKLRLRHAQQRLLEACEQIVREGVVEHRVADVVDAHLPALALLVEAVAHQGQHGVHVFHVGQPIGQLAADAAEQCGGQHRVDGRHLQLEARALAEIALPLELVAGNRLWRAVPAVDRLGHHRIGEHHRVQEGALAHAAVRVWRFRAQQQRGVVDGATGQHEMLGTHGDRHPIRFDALRVHCHRAQLAHLIARELQFAHAEVMHQGGLGLERLGDGADQHRLLGIHRAAVAAIAGVPAAAHIARNHMVFPAQLLAGALQHGVVGIRRCGPGRDAKALGTVIEPALRLLFAPALHPMHRGPVPERLRRRAKTRCPVDGRRAAHRTTLQDGNRAIGGGPCGGLLIEVGIGPCFVHVLEVGRGLQRPLLDQQHLQARRAQNLCGGAAASTGADDHHIGFERLRRGEGGGVANIPAGGDAVGVQVIDGHVCSLGFKRR